MDEPVIDDEEICETGACPIHAKAWRLSYWLIGSMMFLTLLSFAYYGYVLTQSQ